jgi:hypothetical protein
MVIDYVGLALALEKTLNELIKIGCDGCGHCRPELDDFSTCDNSYCVTGKIIRDGLHALHQSSGLITK